MYEDVKEKIHWAGRSGKAYEYNIYKIGTKFKKIPANFIVAQLTTLKKWKPLYVGQSEDLSRYQEKLDAMPCIKENEASHIHVHANKAGLRARLAEENDLLNKWHPDCNGQSDAALSPKIQG